MTVKATGLADGQRAVLEGRTGTLWVVRRHGDLWCFRPALILTDDGELRPYKPEAAWRTFDAREKETLPVLLDNMKFLGLVD